MDPEPPFRYLNHSCEPNCALYYWEKKDEPCLYVETLRRVEADEELTIDYAWAAESAIPCLCGSANCRGWVVAKEELDQVEAELATAR